MRKLLTNEEIRGLLSSKSVYDRKPSSGLDRKPSSDNVYSFTNTHKKDKRAVSSQEKTLIIKDENIRQGFAQVPNIVLRDSSLSGNEKTLYALLLSYAWQDAECFPGQERLAKNMGLTSRSIRQLLSELRGHHLIGWKRQGLGKVNLYHINRLTDAYPQLVDKGSQG